nr:glucose n-acetyltransferase 1 [Quercus suber]
MSSLDLPVSEDHRKRNLRSRYDDVDDRLHDIYRIEPEESIFRWPRKSRLLALLSLVGLYLLYWTTRPSRRDAAVDWSRFAYVLYATNDHELCHAYMVFDALKHSGSKADRLLLHNPQFASLASGGDDRNAQLLSRAEKLYNVKLKPARLLDSRGEVLKANKASASLDDSTSEYSITKLRAFELTEYDRVIALESDITLRDHIDELFLLPPAPIALARAYWSHEPVERWPLSSVIMVIEPNPAELTGLLDTLQAWRRNPDQQSSADYEESVINHRFGASSIVIPHRPYLLQSAEYRRHAHAPFLGNINGPANHLSHWDPKKVLAEAKIIHFNDWPLPKPWIMWPHDAVQEMQPDCDSLGEFQYSCKEREIWKDLYDDFRKRRKDMCGLLSVPAPDWNTWKHSHGVPEGRIIA